MECINININTRCEICGRIYANNEIKGSVSVCEFKNGIPNEARYLSANTCPYCTGKVLDFVGKLIHGDE